MPTQHQTDLNQLIKWISMREALKKEVSVGNIREIVGVLSDICALEPNCISLLIENGKKRLSKRKRK